MPSKVYIAHFYPPEDATNFWRTDDIIEVMGQVFLSHAEAANQLAQELGDVRDSNLPVSGFVIEAVECPEGYRVSDCYELSEGEGSHKRAANPKGAKSAALSPEAFAAFAKDKKARAGGGAASATKPKTVTLKAASGKAASGKTAPAPAATPATPTKGKRGRKPQQYVYQSRPTTPVAQRKRVGEVIAGTNEAWLAELEGIERGQKEIKMPKGEAAERYSEFVAEYAPWDVPARKISGAMMKKLRGATGQSQYEIQFEARKKGNERAGQELMTGLKSGKLAEGTREDAVEKVKDARLALREAKKANDVPAIEKAQTDLALNEAKANLLTTLEAWCPWYCQTEKGKSELAKARKGQMPTDIGSKVGYSVIEEIRDMEAQARTTALAAKRQDAEAKKTAKKAEREDAKNNKVEARRLKAEAREQEKEAKRLEAEAKKQAADAAKAAAAAKVTKTTKTTKTTKSTSTTKTAKSGAGKAIKASRPKKAKTERIEFTVLTDAELAEEKRVEAAELAKAKTADRKAASTKNK